jgi:membrane protease YdiL (CAAX protease family)
MLKDYLRRSCAPRYSVVFALPLLVLYELLTWALSGSGVSGVRNGADVLLKSLFVALGGRDGLVVFGIMLGGAGGAIVWRDLKRSGEPLHWGVFGWMLAESAAYAAVFGTIIGSLTALLLEGPHALAVGGAAALGLQTQLVVSLGAGIYEELLFRVVLVGVLLWLGRRLGVGTVVSGILAIVLSALIFSAFHYVGSLGDRFTVASFTFRAIAGVAFSALYVARGFGITAWTHALYDLGLSLLQAAS